MMNDAQNAKIWNHCEAYLCEFASMYCAKPSSLGDTDDETFYFKMLGDMQIQSRGTGKAARRVTLDQCRSIGLVDDKVATCHPSGCSRERDRFELRRLLL